MSGRSFRTKRNTPVTWPLDHFGLITVGERQDDALAVCTAHRGAHIFYLDGCHALPPHQSRWLNPRPGAPVVAFRLTLDLDDLIDLARARRARRGAS